MHETLSPKQYWVLQHEVSTTAQLYDMELLSCDEAEFQWLTFLVWLSSQKKQTLEQHSAKILVGPSNTRHLGKVPFQEVSVLTKKFAKSRTKILLPKVHVSFGAQTSLALTGLLAGSICVTMPNFGENNPICTRPLVDNMQFIERILKDKIAWERAFLGNGLSPYRLLNRLLSPLSKASKAAEVALLEKTVQTLHNFSSYTQAILFYLDKIGIPHEAKKIEQNITEYAAYYREQPEYYAPE